MTPCFDRFRKNNEIYCTAETKLRQYRKVLFLFMEYVVYGDFYWIVNFIMNVFMLIITAMLRQRHCHIGRMLIVSAAMAFVSLAVLFLTWNHRGIRLCFMIPQIAVLTGISYDYEGKASWCRDIFAFLGISILCGGFVTAVLGQIPDSLYEKNRYPMAWVIGAVIVLFLLFVIFRWEIAKERQRQKSMVNVLICHGNREYAIKALYDTGNHLRSPYTGESVAILSEVFARKIQLDKGQKPLCIPYRTIDGSGTLWAYRIDCIQIERGVQRKHVLTAVSDKLTGEIPMILNVEQDRETKRGHKKVHEESTGMR